MSTRNSGRWLWRCGYAEGLQLFVEQFESVLLAIGGLQVKSARLDRELHGRSGSEIGDSIPAPSSFPAPLAEVVVIIGLDGKIQALAEKTAGSLFQIDQVAGLPGPVLLLGKGRSSEQHDQKSGSCCQPYVAHWPLSPNQAKSRDARRPGAVVKPASPRANPWHGLEISSPFRGNHRREAILPKNHQAWRSEQQACEENPAKRGKPDGSGLPRFSGPSEEEIRFGAISCRGSWARELFLSARCCRPRPW